MNDPRLDQYIDRVVEYLKRSNYKNKDIKDSFNKAIPKPAKQNIFFLKSARTLMSVSFP